MPPNRDGVGPDGYQYELRMASLEYYEEVGEHYEHGMTLIYDIHTCYA